MCLAVRGLEDRPAWNSERRPHGMRTLVGPVPDALRSYFCVLRRAAALGPELVHGGDERDPDAGGGRNEIWHGAKSYPSAVAPRMSFPHPWAVFRGRGQM